MTSETREPKMTRDKQVAAEVVGAEQVVDGGPDVHGRVVLEVGGLEREDRGQHGQQDHERHPRRGRSRT